MVQRWNPLKWKSGVTDIAKNLKLITSYKKLITVPLKINIFSSRYQFTFYHQDSFICNLFGLSDKPKTYEKQKRFLATFALSRIIRFCSDFTDHASKSFFFERSNLRGLYIAHFFYKYLCNYISRLQLYLQLHICLYNYAIIYLQFIAIIYLPLYIAQLFTLYSFANFQNQLGIYAHWNVCQNCRRTIWRRMRWEW